VRSVQEGWAHVEPLFPGAPPAIIDRGLLSKSTLAPEGAHIA
jgi:hypothetical protein